MIRPTALALEPEPELEHELALEPELALELCPCIHAIMQSCPFSGIIFQFSFTSSIYRFPSSV